MSTLATAARTVGRWIVAGASWVWGCFSHTVTSAAKRIDAHDVKIIATKTAAPIVAGAGLWQGFKHALQDPEALAAVVGAIIVFSGAMIEGMHRYHHDGAQGSTPPPLPNDAMPSEPAR